MNRYTVRKSVAIAAVALVLAACTRAVYPIAAPMAPVPTTASVAEHHETTDARNRTSTLEDHCRAQPGGTTRSLAAVDAMRNALGSACTVESVDNDPLLWLFRCQADAFFPLGQYAFPDRGPARPCPGEPAVRGNNGWVCAGATLGRLLAQSSDAGIEGARVVFVGHVDEVHLQPATAFDPCPSLVSAFRYADGRTWTRLSHGDPRLDREGNNQLAWCRAASVAQQVLCGVGRSAGGAQRAAACGTVQFDPSAHPGFEVALVGASTLWQQHQPASICPACEHPGEATQCACAEARRVDVLVQFRPRERQRAQTSCTTTPGLGSDARTLYCLQDCLEARSVLAEEAPLERHEIFTACNASSASPDGWYEAVDGPHDCARTQRDLLRRIVGL